MFLRTLVGVAQGETRRRVTRTLNALDAIAETVASVDDLRKRMARKPFDLVVLDLDTLSGFTHELIRETRELPEAPEVMVLMDHDDSELRAALLGVGAFAVLDPTWPEEVFSAAFSNLADRRLEEARARLQPVPDEDFRLGDYVTSSPAMKTFLRSARHVASRDSTILLLGETGVGKGLLARSLHNESQRSDCQFVSINCGAVMETLLEAELFGHERGAFTGADRARRGYFEMAHGGTLFLDEIAEIPSHLQVKLLAVLEERRVRPVGSEKSISIDVRLMAATNRDLSAEVKEGRFREDLFYRLNVVTLTLPSLRERPEDISEIAQSYLEHHRIRMPADVERISSDAVEALVAYSWPGNVRELSNAIERAVIMATETQIGVSDLPAELQEAAPSPIIDVEMKPAEADPAWLERPWAEVRREVLEETERSYLSGLLTKTGGRIGETAQRAGMDPRSLHQKMRKYGLRKEAFRGS